MLFGIIKSLNQTIQKRGNYTTMRSVCQVVLPLELGTKIPEGDFVFKLAEICESLDYTELINMYLRNWRKVNPVTMFELIVYGYMKHLYSGRDIAEACRTDTRFMWLLDGEPAPRDNYTDVTLSTYKKFRMVIPNFL